MRLQEYVVTVLMPVYNAGEFLPACLESLRKQTYKNLQIIAIDDFSKDRSYTLLKKFQKTFKGLEVYKNKKRYGLPVCYNRAIKRAKGHFIVFMNPQDMNALSRFKQQVDFLLKNPKTVAVGSQYITIDKNNRKIEKSNLPQDPQLIYNSLLMKMPLHPETIMINRKLLPKDLLYFKKLKYPNVFTDILVRLFMYGKVVNLSQYLYYHRSGIKTNSKQGSKVKKYLNTIGLWLTFRADYDYRPPLRSLMPPLVKGL
jgi:glycosyltransferase involved in cell wall biosynthesis